MSERALEYTLEAYPDADITVLTVVGEPSLMWGEAVGFALADDLEDEAQELAQPVFDHARTPADTNGLADLETIVELGHPVRTIINRADDYETVVIGTYGGTVSERLFVGDVAETVVRRSPVPVVVVR